MTCINQPIKTRDKIIDEDKFLWFYPWWDFYAQDCHILDEEYKANFGYGELTYKNIFIEIITADGSDRQKFVVAIEIPTENDLERLRRYCQCKKCIGSWCSKMWHKILIRIGNNTNECLRDCVNQKQLTLARRAFRKKVLGIDF